MAERQQCRFNREELRRRLKARGIKGELLDFILSKYPKDYRCKREAYKDGMCVFHSEEKPKNFEELFWQEFKRMEREEKEIDFTGAIFPVMQFSSEEKPLKVKKSIDFSGASFQKGDFTGAEFQETYFVGAKFQRASFKGAEFHKWANFSYAEFQEVSFKGAKFQRASFKGAEFHGTAILEFVLRKNQSTCTANFEFAKFESQVSFKPELHDGALLFYMTEFRDPRKVTIVVPLSVVSFLQTDLTDVTLVPSERSKKISDQRILDEKLWEYHKSTKRKDRSESWEEKSSGSIRMILGIVGRFLRGTTEKGAFLSNSEKEAYKILRNRLARELVIAEYKNIRKCLEANRMFTEASSLFIREMRLARSRLSWRKIGDISEKIAHYAFDILARYGESMGRPILWSFLVIFLSSLYLAWVSHPSEAIPSLFRIMGIVTSVFFQIRSLGDFFNEMYAGQLLGLEILIRLSSVLLLGSLFIALKRRLERK